MHELTNTIFRISRYQELWGVWNLSYLQAYKLDGCNFINAGRIWDTWVRDNGPEKNKVSKETQPRYYLSNL